jgi:hypothetical protein
MLRVADGNIYRKNWAIRCCDYGNGFKERANGVTCVKCTSEACGVKDIAVAVEEKEGSSVTPQCCPVP